MKGERIAQVGLNLELQSLCLRFAGVVRVRKREW